MPEAKLPIEVPLAFVQIVDSVPLSGSTSPDDCLRVVVACCVRKYP